jgi:hypothetical protein
VANRCEEKRGRLGSVYPRRPQCDGS